MNSKQTLTTRTSVSAVTSMVFGLMSPVVLCGTFSTTITALLAIVLGHVALVKIGKSNGRIFGRWQAITGLVFGYLLLPISLYFAPQFFTPMEQYKQVAESLRENREGSTPGANAMRAAEMAIGASSRGVASGNNSKATELAREYSRLISEAVNASFVEEGDWGSTTELNDKFNVYCELNDDSVCFLVKVPGYRKYKDDSRDALDEIAWLSGLNAVNGSDLPVGAELGIGLKGNFLFGTVMIGPSDSERPKERPSSKESLRRFFR